jgi:hypothetical protein
MGIIEELQSLQKRFDDIPTMVMSPKAYGSLVKVEPQYLSPSLLGAPVVQTDKQLTTPVVRSLDQFAEYDVADMFWAEPLGLAEWYDVDVDVIAMKPMQSMQAQFAVEMIEHYHPYSGVKLED